jgi:hypothetical protein
MGVAVLKVSAFPLALLAGAVLCADGALAQSTLAQAIPPQPVLSYSDPVAVVDQLSDASATSASAIVMARRQEAAGDLTGAAATLERVLIVDEDADDARLAYASILCRLDDRQSARQELREISDKPNSHVEWAAVRAACGSGLIASTAQNRLAGEASVGLAYDEDAYGALHLEQLGLPQRQQGLAFVGALHLNGSIALPSGYLYGNGGFESRDSVSGAKDDYQLADAAIGYGARRGLSEFAIGGVVRQAWIAGATYATEYGGQVRFSTPAGEHGRVVLNAEAVRQDYSFQDMDGGHYDFAATYEARPSERFYYVVGAGAEYHTAALSTNGYVAARLIGGVNRILDKRGSYVDLSSTVRYVDFGASSFYHRRDIRLFNRLALGTPLGHSGLFVEAAASYTYRGYDQSVGLSDYNSLGGEVRLIWKFGRGG